MGGVAGRRLAARRVGSAAAHSDALASGAMGRQSRIAAERVAMRCVAADREVMGWQAMAEKPGRGVRGVIWLVNHYA
jgi:hypothetical protein